jgi:hypothetical protein
VRPGEVEGAGWDHPSSIWQAGGCLYNSGVSAIFIFMQWRRSRVRSNGSICQRMTHFGAQRLQHATKETYIMLVAGWRS